MEQTWWCTPLIPVLERQRSADLCELFSIGKRIQKEVKGERVAHLAGLGFEHERDSAAPPRHGISLAVHVKISPKRPSTKARGVTSPEGAPEVGRYEPRGTGSGPHRASCIGSEQCAPEAASEATSWRSRQHGAVGAGEAPRPRRAWGAGGVTTEAGALTARLSPLQSRHQKRARAQAQLRNLEAYAAQPHSFVFTRGRAGRSVQQLSLDVRRVMEPLTATRLQVCIPQLSTLQSRGSTSRRLEVDG